MLMFFCSVLCTIDAHVDKLYMNCEDIHASSCYAQLIRVMKALLLEESPVTDFSMRYTPDKVKHRAPWWPEQTRALIDAC